MIRSFPEVFAHFTYPVATQACACALGLYSPEEGKVAEFGKHQQENPLHPLRRHLEECKDTSS